METEVNDFDEHSPGGVEPEAKPTRLSAAGLPAYLAVLRVLAAKVKAAGDADPGAPDATIPPPATGGRKPPTAPPLPESPGGRTLERNPKSRSAHTVSVAMPRPQASGRKK